MTTPDATRTSSVLELVDAQTRRVLETYRVDPGLVQEHANNERRIAQGGYGDRQIYELVQNAADELRDVLDDVLVARVILPDPPKLPCAVRDVEQVDYIACTGSGHSKPIVSS